MLAWRCLKNALKPIYVTPGRGLRQCCIYMRHPPQATMGTGRCVNCAGLILLELRPDSPQLTKTYILYLPTESFSRGKGKESKTIFVVMTGRYAAGVYKNFEIKED